MASVSAASANGHATNERRQIVHNPIRFQPITNQSARAAMISASHAPDGSHASVKTKLSASHVVTRPSYAAIGLTVDVSAITSVPAVGREAVC